MSFASAFLPLGWALGAFALAMLAPLLVALGYGETQQAQSFFLSAVLTAFAAGAIIIATRGVAPRAPRRREGFVLACLIWTVLPGFGALPLYHIGIAESAIDAYFEAVSGFSTTGATVLSDLDIAERSVLIWRGLMQWLGGLSTIVLILVLLSFLGGGGMTFFQSAMPRGERSAMSVQLYQAVRDISGVYALLTVVCAALLWAVGMPPLEAAAQALSTLSTGGFATRDGSIGAFDNPLAELVLVVFMIAGAVNFTLHWAVLHGRHIRSYLDDPEFKALIGLCLAAAAFLSLIFLGGGEGVWTSLRHGVFNAVAAVTTTGYGAGEVSAWPLAAPLLLIMLMTIGGAAGSTAGGLKIMRFAILLKMSGRELKRLIHPSGVVTTRFGDRNVDSAVVRAVWSFFCVFLLTALALALALAMFGVSFSNATALTILSLTNTGAGDGTLISGLAGRGYVDLPDGAKILLCAAMVIGRLEFLTVFVLLSPSFWHR
jgi:trk system potassium uptake protein TrkH